MTLHSTDIVGWTADAEIWCPTCAEKVYGDLSGERHDREGNVISPVFRDQDDDDCCGMCWEPLTEHDCSRKGDDTECGGKVVFRRSRSGLTTSWMCEAHITALDDVLDGIERRYPEMLHPDGCSCWGCSEGSY